MKKTAILLALATAVAMSAGAADFGGKKYYINPGHGGHDSNDRPTAMPLSVVMFYESDGNLSRGLFARSIFQANNASVKMSRTTNTSADDLGLSTIASQSNSYGGYFMSLHTNGANASANYIVAFFRTSSTAKTTESVSGSKVMTQAVADSHNDPHLTNMTYVTPRALGDYSFYGYNLGVLRTNNRPGYLVETVFHDYRPDALRLKSDIYNKYTAWQIVRAAAKKSGSAAGSSAALKGCIIGDIRDLSKTCGYTNYTTRGRDQYLAVDGAKVELLNTAGTVVATYTTGNVAADKGNGLFGFFDLANGTYSVRFTKSGYKTVTKSATVSGNTATKVLFDAEAGTSTGISVSPSTLDAGSINVGATKAMSLKITGTGLSSAITVSCDNAAFALSATSVAAAGGTITVTYKPTAAGTHKGTITLTSGTHKITVIASGSAVNPPLTLTEGWQYSEAKGNKASLAWLPAAGWGALRNMCFGGGKLYIVSPSTSQVFVVKAQDPTQKICELNMTGVEGGTFKIMDIKYVDGKAIGCNLAANAEEPIKVYVWDTDTSAPRCILNTTSRTGALRIGDTFDVEGTLNSGRLIFAWAGNADLDSEVITYALNNGTASTTPTGLKTRIDDATKITLGTSPRAVTETDNRFWVMGQSYAPTLTDPSGLASKTVNLDALDNVVQGNDFERFMFKGTHYALATTYKAPAQANNTSLTGGSMVLLDGTDGWSSCKKLANYPANGLGTTRNTNFSTSVCLNVNGTSGVETWVLVSNQGIAYYKNGTVPTYSYTDPTALSLDCTMADTDFGSVKAHQTAAKTFTVTGANLTADINIALSGANADQFDVTPTTIAKATAQGTVTVTYAPLDAGAHTATLTVSTAGLPAKTYTLRGTGVTLDDSIKDMNQEWVHLATAPTTWWSDKGAYTRDIAVAGGQLYELNTQASSTGGATLNAMNAYSNNASHNSPTAVSVDGVAGGLYSLGSIASLGTGTINSEKLFGCNVATTAQPLLVYRWDSSASAPVKVLEDATHGSIRVGDILSTSGTLADGKLLFCDGTKIVWYQVTNSAVNATAHVVTLANTYESTGAAVQVNALPDGTFWIYPKGAVPTHIAADGSQIEQLPKAVIGDSYGTAGKVFNYGARTYMAATAYLDKAATTLADGCIKLIDLTNGAANATCVGTYPEAGLGAARNTTFITSLEHQVSDDGMRVNLFTHIPYQGMAMYRYDGALSAIENICIDEAQAQADDNAEYFTLQGVSIKAQNLTPGIYIRRQGQQAQKVVVK